MTPKTALLLADPHPDSHIVYPYSDESHVTEAVSVFAYAGLSNNEAVVLVTTEGRRSDIERRLMADGFDIQMLEQEGRLIIYHADELLYQVLDAEVPDGKLFASVIGRIIETARQKSPTGKVRVYGEMVNLLCSHNNVAAAARLEDLWNEAIAAHKVPLLCSYSLDVLPEGGRLPANIMEAHSHVLSA